MFFIRCLIVGTWLLAAACTSSPQPLLNSERIRQTFGSYGVEIVAQTDRLRYSCLYSVADDVRTCRTLAVVRFADMSRPELQAALDAVRAGGSLGETLRDAGFRVTKLDDYVGNLHVDPADQPNVAAQLQLRAGTGLALHVYRLRADRANERTVVATVLELHHPDYLTAADLVATLGRAHGDGTAPRRYRGWLDGFPAPRFN